MHTPSAHPAPQALAEGDPVRAAVLQSATEPLRDAFGSYVQVQVERLDRLGRWAFLQGTMRADDGGRPDYSGTVFASRRADGAMSDTYAALVRKADDGGTDDDPFSWRLKEHVIGPTDVAWMTWPKEHDVPPELFGF